jgi:hypothetical protein
MHSVQEGLCARRPYTGAGGMILYLGLLVRELYVLQGHACVQRVQQEDVHVVVEASPFCLKLQGKWNRGKMMGVM